MFKRLIVLVVFMFGLTAAQEITLKKLYDGIEDLRLEYKMRNVQPSPNAHEKDSKELTAILIKNHVKTNQTCGEETVPIPIDDVYVIAKIAGSFTKPRVQQTLYVYSTCNYAFGLAILELGKPIAVYDSGLYYNAFAVKDINENGLNEVMLEVQSKAKDAWGEMHAVHLLEFKDAKPTSLGSFFIGGPPHVYAGGGDYIICNPNAPKALQKSFPSNILYVRKGKIPQFFAEGFEINCDYRRVGVNASKISGLIPVKAVPRDTGLERQY